jgi:hypothetical protein
MNIFKEIKDDINEVDSIQKQLTPREKASAILGVVFVVGFILLSFTQGFGWATIFFMIIIVANIILIMSFFAMREMYYIIKNIRYDMRGMW